jgi:hypothetical protein
MLLGKAGAGSQRAASESVSDVVELKEPSPGGQAAQRRSPLERAVLVPIGAALLALEELIGVASALTDAEKASRELLHFEERGMRARAHVGELIHHHRARVADELELQIEQARGRVNGLAEKGTGLASKIRPHLPTE